MKDHVFRLHWKQTVPTFSRLEGLLLLLSDDHGDILKLWKKLQRCCLSRVLPILINGSESLPTIFTEALLWVPGDQPLIFVISTGRFWGEN